MFFNQVSLYVFVCVCLKALNTLQNLKDLNLADNNIEKIGRFLESSVFSVPRLIEVYWALWKKKNK